MKQFWTCWICPVPQSFDTEDKFVGHMILVHKKPLQMKTKDYKRDAKQKS